LIFYFATKFGTKVKTRRGRKMSNLDEIIRNGKYVKKITIFAMLNGKEIILPNEKEIFNKLHYNNNLEQLLNYLSELINTIQRNIIYIYIINKNQSLPTEINEIVTIENNPEFSNKISNKIKCRFDYINKKLKVITGKPLIDLFLYYQKLLNTLKDLYSLIIEFYHMVATEKAKLYNKVKTFIGTGKENIILEIDEDFDIYDIFIPNNSLEELINLLKNTIQKIKDSPHWFYEEIIEFI